MRKSWRKQPNTVGIISYFLRKFPKLVFLTMLYNTWVWSMLAHGSVKSCLCMLKFVYVCATRKIRTGLAPIWILTWFKTEWQKVQFKEKIIPWVVFVAYEFKNFMVHVDLDACYTLSVHLSSFPTSFSFLLSLKCSSFLDSI